MSLSFGTSVLSALGSAIVRTRDRCNRLAERLSHMRDPRYRDCRIDYGVHLGNARLEGRNVIGFKSILTGDVEIGYATTLGRRCVLFGGTIKVGRFAQFAPEVAVYAKNHPFDHMTNYVNEILFEGRMKPPMQNRTVTIGNDVWIGHGALLLGDLAVGDGAII